MTRMLWLLVLCPVVIVACKIPDENFSRPVDAGADADPSCARPGFPGPPLLRTAGTPVAVVAADLNNDTRPDFVAATTSGAISVLLATGPGTFAPRTDYPIGSVSAIPPIAEPLQVADLDNDGDLDLVIANRPSGNASEVISVMRNNGDGTFAPKSDVSLTSSPSVGVKQFVVVDLFGDGNVDIVVAASNNSQLPILINNGAGDFNVSGPIVGFGQVAVAVGDLDNNMRQDVLVAISNGAIKVFLGVGGGIAPGNDVAGSGNTLALELADLDGSGSLDLVIADVGGSAAISLGDGNGNFAAADDNVDLGSGPLQSFAVVDVNGDGGLDVVAATDDTSQGFVTISINNGDGSFIPSMAFETGQEEISSLGIGKLDNDSLPDLVVTSIANDRASVLLNSGGTFPVHVDHVIDGDPGAVVVTDLDADGKSDVAIATASPAIRLLRNNGDGTLRDDDSPAAFGAGSRPVSIAVADVSGDGRPDAIVANENANTASVLLGVETTFASPAPVITASQPRALAIAMINTDTDTVPDLVVANASSNSVSVLLGFKDGVFQTRQDVATGSLPSAVVADHLNTDGKIDLVVGTASGVNVLLGDGTGAFPARLDSGSGAITGVATGDLDNDGDIDIVTVSSNTLSVGVLLNNGSGTVQPAATSPLLTGFGTSVALADLDGDGDLDIVCTSGVNDASKLSVLINQGSATFADPVDHATGRSPASLAIADVNLDGKLDLVTANVSAGTASVLLGNGDAEVTFQPALDFLTGAGSTSIAIADVDLDGRPDLVSANSNANTVSVLRNTCLP